MFGAVWLELCGDFHIKLKWRLLDVRLAFCQLASTMSVSSSAKNPSDPPKNDGASIVKSYLDKTLALEQFIRPYSQSSCVEFLNCPSREFIVGWLQVAHMDRIRNL